MTLQHLVLSLAGLAPLLLASPATAGGGSILCVDPVDGACFQTIQSAVDAADPGDTVRIAAKAGGAAYGETVVIETAGLTVEGSAAPAFTITNFDQLLELDWPTERASCPVTVVDACETEALGASCGFQNEAAAADARNAFVIRAPGVTLANLTIRFADVAVRLDQGSDNAVVRDNCIMRSVSGIWAGEQEITEVDGVTIQRNRLFNLIGKDDPAQGPADTFFVLAAVDLYGDDALIELNLMHSSSSLQLGGGGHTVRLNAQHYDTLENSVFINSSSTVFEENWYLQPWEDGLETTDQVPVATLTLRRNLLDLSGSNDGEALDLRGASLPQLLAEENEIIGASDQGIDITNAPGAVIRDNTVSLAGFSSEAGIAIRGSLGATVSDNRVTDSQIGIRIVDAENVELEGNTVEDSLATGVLVLSESSGAVLTDNQILGTYGDGLAQQSGATGTAATGNTILGLTLDVCNQGSFATFSGNTFNTGGTTTPCLVFAD